MAIFRRTIYFKKSEEEAINRFYELYHDLFQTRTCNERPIFNRYNSEMQGYDNKVCFHMNKKDFANLVNLKIITKVHKASYKNEALSESKRDIWVLCN